jgi:hypothetical protein
MEKRVKLIISYFIVIVVKINIQNVVYFAVLFHFLGNILIYVSKTITIASTKRSARQRCTEALAQTFT